MEGPVADAQGSLVGEVVGLVVVGERKRNEELVCGAYPTLF